MERMNRYWVFAGERYYPSGGFDDFKSDFSQLDEAQDLLTELLAPDADGCSSMHQWGHIVDSYTGKKVEERQQ